ncbi:MAG: ankyrin repeat protein [Bryobacterales bacterium]|nr:ankyrin repeat protein [Bryobacterales bacterium]
MRIRHAMAACAVILVPAIYLTVLNAANSPVADAAMKGDKAAVQTLIQQKADVNVPQADGATAIQWAAYRNDPEIADLLIAAGADVKKPNHDGATALRLAATNGSAAMIQKLLKAGADPNEVSPNGETPLMFVARNGSVDAVKVLVEAKADVNAKEKLRGTTPLMWAAEQSHPEAIKVLLASGADYKATSSFDTKGGRAYLAPTVRQRAESAQGAGGIGNQGKQGGRGAAGQAKQGGAGRGQGKQAQQAKAGEAATEEDVVAAADAAAADFSFGRQRDTDGGGITSLVFATRQNCLECVKALLDAGADVNQVTHYGWTPLLTATHNRHYKIAAYLLDHGADPNIKNNGGWSPLYLATDNRNIESGDYPVRKPDMDHMDFIKLLLAKNADVNVRVCGTQSTATTCVGDSTETRTNFTMQWLNEDGATPFLRAAQSSDVELMKLLLAHGADPKIATARNVTPLAVAAGIAWVEGVTFETSREQNQEAVKMLLDLGIDPNIHDEDGRTSLHGAAHKGRNEIVQMLVDRGGDLTAHDNGSRDTVNGAMRGVTWVPLHYSQGLVRVGVQSAIAHPETAAFIKKLMTDKGLPIPPDITSSICLTKGVNGCQ